MMISTLFFLLLHMSPIGNERLPDSCYAFADSTSSWKGFTRYHMEIEGRKAFITAPHQALANREWIWRARFPEWHTDMDELLLEAGFHVAYINTDNMFGSPLAMEIWDRFYSYLVDELAFCPKVSLEGVSRGGLFVFNWAKRNPWKVHSIYTEAPVCDIKSWPGGFGAGKGDPVSWELLKKAYGFANDQEAMAFDDNPKDNLEDLALARVPVLAMIGLNDQVVPPEENIFILSDNYVKAGGLVTLVPCTRGREGLMGHHFSIETPEMGAEFILSCALRPILPLSSAPYQKPGSGLGNSLARFDVGKEGKVAFLGGSITQNGGWRDSVCNYLQQRFPHTRFTFIPAGIASMGSTPGAFRLERDVLSKGPVDLLFVEAAVNDATNGRSKEEQIRGMEGIIRHTLRANPDTDVVLMHFADPDKMEQYNRGEVPEVIQNFELVAGHYQVGTINLAREVTHRINNEEFTWAEDFLDLHPSPFGQSLYFQSIRNFLESQFKLAEMSGKEIMAHRMPDALDPWCYDQGKIIPFTKISEKVGFEHIKDWTPALHAATRNGYTRVDMLVGDRAGDSFTLPFEGRAIGIMVAAGPDAGIIEFSIDGGKTQTRDLFTAWSGQLYLPWFHTLAAELEPGPHTLWVSISKDRNKKSLGNGCILKSFYVNE